MFPFRKILFPADYSDPCRSVAPHVRDMREHFSAELAMVHAYGLGAFYGEVAMADPGAIDEMQRLEEQRLQEFVVQIFPACVWKRSSSGAAVRSNHRGASLDRAQ